MYRRRERRVSAALHRTLKQQKMLMNSLNNKTETSDNCNGSSELAIGSGDQCNKITDNGNTPGDEGEKSGDHDNKGKHHVNKSNHGGSYLVAHTKCENGTSCTPKTPSPKVAKKSFYRRFSRQASNVGHGGMTIDKTVGK